VKPGIGNRESGIVVALFLAAAPLQAQLTRNADFGLGVSSTRLTAVSDAGTARFSGIVLGGGGGIGRGLVSVEGGYRQGSLTPDSGAVVAQDLVEARLLVALRPLPWLSVLAGPHARAFVAPGGTERWMFFEAGLRVEGPVVIPSVSTHVELWAALGGSVNVGSGSPSARGGEAGVTLHLPRSPVWGRLTYAMDRATQSGGTNIRTVEDLRLSIGVGGR
jgi:hypothetical protein